jgi:hypothetical protein
MAMFCALAVLPTEGVCRGGIIGKDNTIRLRTVPSLDALSTEIEKRITPAGGRLFSVSSRTFLGEIYLPLVRKGLLKELFLLLPGENPMKEGDLTGIRNCLAAAGVSSPDRASFHLDNGAIRGLMEGASVRLFPLTRIPAWDGKEVVLLIDPEFLLPLYRNEVKTPIVELAWKLLVTLRGKNVRSEDVFLLDLPSGDDASLRYAFLSILLGEMIVSPSSFDENLPRKWEILQQAENAAFFGQYPETMTLYRRYLELSPKDASACYKIAMAAVRDLDDDMALHWLNRAAALDSRFLRGFVTASDYLGQRRLFDPAERILRAGTVAYPKEAPLATSLAAFLLMRGERILQTGDIEGAEAYFRMAAGVEGADKTVIDKARSRIGRNGSPLPVVPR